MADPFSKVRVSPEEMDQFEAALGFFPYGNESLLDASDQDEFIVPYDVRVHLLGKVASNTALSEGDALHAHTLKNLETHITHELEDSQLYGYQQEVVHSIKDFLQYPEYDHNDEPIRAGYIKLPTATGKTAIYAHTINEITREAHKQGEALKTLILVPGRDLVDQTVGVNTEAEGAEEDTEELLRGFAKFAPDKIITEYHGGKKDLSGDVVVMTYQSLNRAIDGQRFDTSMFDVIVGDEIHCALGVTTKNNLLKTMENKITIGFSATTEYGINKKVKDLLPTEIYRMELRDAIESGYLAPVRALAITTNDKIIASGRNEFKEEELLKLIESEWRNKTAVTIAKEFIEEGQQGIITCLPGENLRHAREMAARLSGTEATDQNTGEKRNIHCEVVAGEMTARQRKDLYRRFETGEVDVITAVDLLNEGWDSVTAKFLINLRPTTSQVLGVQRLGRILRPGKDGELATIVEFIDDIEKPGKNLFTFYHAMDEQTVTQNKIYGRPKHNSADPGLKHAPVLELPNNLKKLIADMDHKVLDDRIFGKIPVGGDEYLSLTAACAEILHISHNYAQDIAEELGIEGRTMRFGMRYAQGYSRDEIKQIGERFTEKYGERPPEGFMPMSGVATLLGTTVPLSKKLVEHLEIKGVEYLFSSHKTSGYSPEQVKQIQEKHEAEKQLLRLAQINRFIGLTTRGPSKVVCEIIKELEIEPTKNSQNATLYRKEDAEAIAEAYRNRYGDVAPSGYMNINMLANDSKIASAPTLRKIARQLNITVRRMRFSNGKSSPAYSPEEVEQILSVARARYKK